MFSVKDFTLLKRTILLFVFLILCLPSVVRANKVTDWNLIANTAEANLNRTNNGLILVDLAYMHIAVYDAVNAIDGRYTVFAVRPTNVQPGASQDAAAVEAAYRVIRFLIPQQAAYLDAQYSASMATIPDGQAKNRWHGYRSGSSRIISGFAGGRRTK